jgi:laminin, gamma 1
LQWLCMLFLARMDRVDTARLDDLERNLTSTERLLADNKIETRYNELETLSTQIDTWIADYSTQLDDLRIDIRRVDSINKTIPRGCFQKVNLEPTEPKLLY